MPSTYTLRIGVSAFDFSFLDLSVETEGGWSLLTKDDPMTLRHLMMMTSGYGLIEAPGERYAYNDYGVELFAETLEVMLGGTLDSFVDGWFATPMQFQDGGGFDFRDGHGVGFSVRDFCRLGWLSINHGDWDGTRILPAEWFEEYMGVEVVSSEMERTAGEDAGDYLTVGTFGGPINDTGAPGMGRHGWFVWVNTGGSWPGAPADTYFWAGHGGQRMMMVVPSLELVACWIGTHDDLNDVGNASSDFNTLIAGLIDGITGDPTYAADFPGADWTDADDTESGISGAAVSAFASATSEGCITRRGRRRHEWNLDGTKDLSSGAKPMLALMLVKAAYEEVI